MSQHTSFWRSGSGLAALGLIGVATYFLWMEHREHVAAFLPYLLILACPLMHIFMHRGHGNDHSKDANTPSSTDDYQRGFDDAIKKQQRGHTH